MPPQEKNLDELDRVIDTWPIIDNHAHPLLKAEYLDKYSLLSIASEAHGDALPDHKSSLPHLRATSQLATLLGCDNSWDHVEAAIQHVRKTDPEAWTRRCLAGIETLLLDDGLDGPGEVHGYAWHDRFTRSKCKRIVRIETVAQDIIRTHCAQYLQDQTRSIPDHVEQIFSQFQQAIKQAVEDPEVVGFKSIICYRSGLDISRRASVDKKSVATELAAILEGHANGAAPFQKLRHSRLNQLLVHVTASAIAEGEGQKKKPFQFHTGLGDNDITLTRSSPSHLQDFIRDHPSVPIVLLHGGYPWTREMGYLATHYANVYADIGEVFPMVSRHGQESILRQILELCPWTKVLWSTDGHWFPETYVLATIQARNVFKSVLGDLVHLGDLSQAQAIQLVKDVFFNNSNKLYDLHIESPGAVQAPTVAAQHTDLTGSVALCHTERPSFIQQLRNLGPKWLRVYWHDYTSSARCMLVPMGKVWKSLERDGQFSVAITKASLGILQVDMCAPGVTGTGMYRFNVDWTTMKAGPVTDHVSCFGHFTDDGAEVPLCPRTLLRNTLRQAAGAGLSFLIGFEIEFVVMQRTTNSSGNDAYQTLPNDGHAWGMSRVLADWGRDGSFRTAVDEIMDALDHADISIEAFHPESAPGQYEIVLSALPPMEACDTLLHARQIIESVVARHDFRVTLHPKPFPRACGTATHMHLSVTSKNDGSKADAERTYKLFYGGIMDHMAAILAVTYPSPASYERMVDSFWAGGRWITWGTQNKEAPLRQCEGSHWEFKTMDGLANPYFAVTAVLSAGLDSILRTKTSVDNWGDCKGDPAKLSDLERKELRITKMFPANLPEALRALEKDQAATGFLSRDFVERYVTVKDAEVGLLSGLSDEERRTWIIARY
ncbi:uncharacterized protein B0I36DRAFT_293428 [Microdochium trichocladiopsis]|uniref:GS catalytic domain-containing protein n=1 Tax=Microdochium trichocladiopsis TaxID=1682393 RepID=A0A9P8Y233_9PEZI|nr:uncharacterized protein B0I36DRAFT_293428 [Microdochium trichocladiopsis]KAH7025762.1 hypothetical protein B0I36DRAFT_293428 [Microdochium trichocladiopsis]